MVEYKCDCCNYTTDRKLNYDRHLSSDKHLKKTNNETNKSTNLSKDEIIKNQQEEINNLKNEINDLKQKLVSQEPAPLFSKKLISKPKQENIVMKIEEVVKKDPAELNLNIEEFLEKYIKKGGETKYTQVIYLNEIKKTVIKFEYLKKGCIYNLKKVINELLLNGLKELPDGVNFYEVVNKRLNRFKIRTNDKIITTKHDEKEVDDSIKKLLTGIYYFLRRSISSFVTTDHSLKLHSLDSECEEMIKEARTKRMLGEELTSIESHYLKKDDWNFKIKESFKKLTNIDFDNLYKNWYDNEIMKQFHDFNFDTEFLHFKVLLARKTPKTTETQSDDDTETTESLTDENTTEEE